MLLGSVQLGTYKEKLILNNTTQQIKSSLEQAARISTIRHRAALVRYYPVSKRITIIGNGYSRTLKIDSGLEIYNLENLKISASGSMPPHTIVITNHKNTKRVKLQMTWGRAIDGT
ncbi:Prepilin-type cleavage/methylation protein [Lactobacillus sp. XV13L]|nr:Prepilin-type cleavage/methylation protein [Lactobacillus sp. XV13L]